MREKKQSIYFRSMVLVLLMALATGMFASVTVKAAPAKPSVTFTKRTKKTATIKIKKKGNVSGYQIFFKTSKKGKFRQIMGIRNQSYTIKGLKPKKTYYVKVRAFKTKGYRIMTGKFSKVITIKPYKKKTNTKPDTSEEKEETTADVTQFAQKVLELVNKARAEEGLDALVLDEKVMAAADVRAKELVVNYSHERPVTGASPFTALNEAGAEYQMAGENIAAGQATPEMVVEAWLNSEGHRANILNPDFKKLGVGYSAAEDDYGHYWVQLFTD